MDTHHRVTARFADDDEAPIMPPAPSKSKPHASRQVDLTQEAEDPSLGVIMNHSKAKIPEPTRMPAGPAPSEGGWDDGEDGGDEADDDMGDEEGFDDPFNQNVSEGMVANAEKIKAKKMDFLNKLYRISQEAGVVVPEHLSIKTPLDEIEAEYSKITYDIGVRKSIRLQRRMLMGLFSTIEMANEMSGGPDELAGVSRTVFASISDYDGPFTEIYERYGSRVKVHPFVQVMMLAGSTVAYHCYGRSMAKHQSEQDKAKAQADAANDPLAAQRRMRDMEQQYAAEERARDARTAAAQTEAKKQAEAKRQGEAAALARRHAVAEGMLASQNTGTVTPSAYGLQAGPSRPGPQMVPPPMTAPSSRPAPGEYIMKGPGAGSLVGTTTTPGSVGILSEIAPAGQEGVSMSAPIQVVTYDIPTSDFQKLPEEQSEPPTPSGKKPPVSRKAKNKKKDADEVAF